jgi:hypothetical protein
VGEKGGVSVYGLGRFPVTLYYEQWQRLLGALEALTDSRLQDYVAADPNEWRSNNAAADRITEYLQDARENRDPLFGEINRLLK